MHKQFICKFKDCEYQTNDPYHMIKHTKKYHRGIQSGGCDGSCDIMVGGAEDPSLRKLRLKNLLKKYTFKCPICNASFFDRMEYLQHLYSENKHLPIKKRKYA
jgi:hypothetical protein